MCSGFPRLLLSSPEVAGLPLPHHSVATFQRYHTRGAHTDKVIHLYINDFPTNVRLFYINHDDRNTRI